MPACSRDLGLTVAPMPSHGHSNIVSVISLSRLFMLDIIQALLDAVGCIELHGLARDNDGNRKVLTVPREDPLLAKLGASDSDPKATLLPLFTPPSKGHTILSLSVVKKLDEDQHATIYQVCVANKVEGDDFVPPLVIKVAARLDGRRIADEGGIYDVLRPLQGAIVPRCYGYFRTKINHQEMTIKPWDPECDHSEPRPPLDIFNMPNVASSLNILLLEQVGPSVLVQIPSSLKDFECVIQPVYYVTSSAMT